jgi:hypothetical protein
VRGGLSIPEGQFGRKVGKHAAAFGLDASNPEHRERLREMIGEISTSPDTVVEGAFRGQGRIRFFVKDENVVVATSVRKAMRDER